MFPLKKRTLYRGYQAHIKAGLGGAADYVANKNELFAPFNGTIERIYYGSQGGNWLIMLDEDRNSLEFAHLKEYKVKQGEKVKEGQVIAITGNTGNITTGPHLHIQIIQGNKRLDPEVYNWDKGDDVSQEEFDKYKKEQEDKLHHAMRNVVAQYYRAYYFREPTNEAIEDHVSWMKRNSEGSSNYQGIGNWVFNQEKEQEFKDKWVKKTEIPPAPVPAPTPPTEEQEKEIAKNYIIKKLF